MSHKPNPVAMTAAMLALMRGAGHHQRDKPARPDPIDSLIRDAATIASKLHRLGPAFAKHALWECNGETFDGQRDYWNTKPADQAKAGLAVVEERIVKEGERLERKLASINELLQPFGIEAKSGSDPRGVVLWLVATEGNTTLPRNGYEEGVWVIA